MDGVGVGLMAGWLPGATAQVTDEFLDLFAKTQFDEMPEELTHQTAVLLDLWGGKMNSSEVDLPVSFVVRRIQRLLNSCHMSSIQPNQTKPNQR